MCKDLVLLIYFINVCVTADGLRPLYNTARRPFQSRCEPVTDRFMLSSNVATAPGYADDGYQTSRLELEIHGPVKTACLV